MMACVASDAVSRTNSRTSVSVATSVSRRARPRPGSSLRFDPAPLRAAWGACGGLDCACARRGAELWATAEGWRPGAGSGWVAADRGLLPSGRHKFHPVGTNQLASKANQNRSRGERMATCAVAPRRARARIEGWEPLGFRGLCRPRVLGTECKPAGASSRESLRG
jgi:hypothetical protein